MGNMFLYFDSSSWLSNFFNWSYPLFFIILFSSSSMFLKWPWQLDRSIQGRAKISGEWVNKLGPSTSFSLVQFMFGYFRILFVFNLSGLLPFSLACSSHFSFTLSLSLMFWSGLSIHSILKKFTFFFGHLIPYSSPLGLSPLMATVELVGLAIRPLTLSIRLMANMTAGHLILSLLFLSSSYKMFGILSWVGFFGGFLVMSLELFICVVQAYVFMLLASMYIEE